MTKTLYESRKKGRKDAQDAVYINEITPPVSGRKIVADNHREAPRGFAVKVNASGARSFVLRYTSEGKDRLLAIGQHGTWSLAAARKRAIEYRQEIDSGTDVLVARREKKTEQTLGTLAEEFLATKSDHASAYDIEGTVRNHLIPRLGERKLGSVRRREVIDLVEKLAESRPRQASKLLGYVKQLFAWAEDRELLEGNPVATLQANRISRKLKPRDRQRVLDTDEIRRFWHSVEQSNIRRLTALALKLILVTGQRPGECAGMRWSEVDGDTWTIPAWRRGKTETTNRLHLTQTALTILVAADAEVRRLSKRRPETSSADSDYVFQTPSGSPLRNNSLSQAVLRHPQQLGVKQHETWGYWRPHDLRRTMRTGLSAVGVNELIAGLVLGHKRKGIDAVYDHHGYEAEKRAALEAWERHLLEIV